MFYRRTAVLMICLALISLLAEMAYRHSLKNELDKNVLMNSLVGYNPSVGEWPGVLPSPKGFMEKRPEYGLYKPNTDYKFWSYTEAYRDAPGND